MMTMVQVKAESNNKPLVQDTTPKLPVNAASSSSSDDSSTDNEKQPKNANSQCAEKSMVESVKMPKFAGIESPSGTTSATKKHSKSKNVLYCLSFYTCIKCSNNNNSNSLKKIIVIVIVIIIIM